MQKREDTRQRPRARKLGSSKFSCHFNQNPSMFGPVFIAGCASACWVSRFGFFVSWLPKLCGAFRILFMFCLKRGSRARVFFLIWLCCSSMSHCLSFPRTVCVFTHLSPHLSANPMVTVAMTAAVPGAMEFTSAMAPANFSWPGWPCGHDSLTSKSSFGSCRLSPQIFSVSVCSLET